MSIYIFFFFCMISDHIYKKNNKNNLKIRKIIFTFFSTKSKITIGLQYVHNPIF